MDVIGQIQHFWFPTGPAWKQLPGCFQYYLHDPCLIFCPEIPGLLASCSKEEEEYMMILLGETFTVYPSGEISAIGNTAVIETPNISASNGIIHVIDAVILPIE